MGFRWWGDYHTDDWMHANTCMMSGCMQNAWRHANIKNDGENIPTPPRKPNYEKVIEN
jgi:hypothetical protein